MSLFGPGRFNFPEDCDVWTSLVLDTRRNNAFHKALARLKPGVTLDQAQAEMDAIAGRLAQADGTRGHPRWKDRGLFQEPDDFVDHDRDRPGGDDRDETEHRGFEPEAATGIGAQHFLCQTGEVRSPPG